MLIGPLAAASLKALPEPAVVAFRDWALPDHDPADMQPSGGDPRKRTAVFGPGDYGMILATVTDEHQIIIVNQIFWTGPDEVANNP